MQNTRGPAARKSFPEVVRPRSLVSVPIPIECPPISLVDLGAQALDLYYKETDLQPTPNAGYLFTRMVNRSDNKTRVVFQKFSTIAALTAVGHLGTDHGTRRALKLLEAARLVSIERQFLPTEEGNLRQERSIFTLRLPRDVAEEWLAKQGAKTKGRRKDLEEVNLDLEALRKELGRLRAAVGERIMGIDVDRILRSLPVVIEP